MSLPRRVQPQRSGTRLNHHHHSLTSYFRACVRLHHLALPPLLTTTTITTTNTIITLQSLCACCAVLLHRCAPFDAAIDAFVSPQCCAITPTASCVVSRVMRPAICRSDAVLFVGVPGRRVRFRHAATLRRCDVAMLRRLRWLRWLRWLRQLRPPRPATCGCSSCDGCGSCDVLRRLRCCDGCA